MTQTYILIGSPKPTVSWKKVNVYQREVEQVSEPVAAPAEGEEKSDEAAKEPETKPEPVFETVEEVTELPEHVIVNNSKVLFDLAPVNLT